MNPPLLENGGEDTPSVPVEVTRISDSVFVLVNSSTELPRLSVQTVDLVIVGLCCPDCMACWDTGEESQ